MYIGDGHSIYVKSLPMNATPGLLATEFKKFGPIKNGGIQVRSQKVDLFIHQVLNFTICSCPFYQITILQCIRVSASALWNLK